MNTKLKKVVYTPEQLKKGEEMAKAFVKGLNKSQKIKPTDTNEQLEKLSKIEDLFEK